MPMTAQSSFVQSKQSLPIISNKTKLIFVCFVFIFSIWSGKITFLNELGKQHSLVLTVESAYFNSIDTAEYSADKTTDRKPYVISQIAIVQNKFVYPTPTPELPKNIDMDLAWGVAKKVDTHTYTIKVQPDTKNASAQEIFNALNDYRRSYGSGALEWDNNLADFANRRADYFISINNLDSHKGFFDYLNNQDGFKKLGFGTVGENSSYGFTLEAVHLIEWVYGGDSEHNSNQLNTQWRFVGIGVKGSATDVVFASTKF